MPEPNSLSSFGKTRICPKAPPNITDNHNCTDKELADPSLQYEGVRLAASARRARWRRSDAASPSPSAASPPAYSGSPKKKPPTSPSTRCGPGLTPTPRPICTSFSTCTPRKTSKPIARSSANRGKPVVGGQLSELCAL